jgi:hypothetical protein
MGFNLKANNSKGFLPKIQGQHLALTVTCVVVVPVELAPPPPPGGGLRFQADTPAERRGTNLNLRIREGTT